MKFLRFFRNSLVFIAWTFFFVVFTNFLIKHIWGFDFLSVHSWSVLSNFWNQGGIIKTTSDVLLLLSLSLLPFLWIMGVFLTKRLNFWKIFSFPFKVLLRPFFSNDNKTPPRFVIKNIKSSQQQIEDIKAELGSIKPKKSREAESLRAELSKKRIESNS